MEPRGVAEQVSELRQRLCHLDAQLTTSMSAPHRSSGLRMIHPNVLVDARRGKEQQPHPLPTRKYNNANNNNNANMDCPQPSRLTPPPPLDAIQRAARNVARVARSSSSATSNCAPKTTNDDDDGVVVVEDGAHADAHTTAQAFDAVQERLRHKVSMMERRLSSCASSLRERRISSSASSSSALPTTHTNHDVHASATSSSRSSPPPSASAHMLDLGASPDFPGNESCATARPPHRRPDDHQQQQQQQQHQPTMMAATTNTNLHPPPSPTHVVEVHAPTTTTAMKRRSTSAERALLACDAQSPSTHAENSRQRRSCEDVSHDDVRGMPRPTSEDATMLDCLTGAELFAIMRMRGWIVSTEAGDDVRINTTRRHLIFLTMEEQRQLHELRRVQAQRATCGGTKQRAKSSKTARRRDSWW